MILKVSPLKEGAIVIDKIQWELYDLFKCEYDFPSKTKENLPKQLEEKKKIFSCKVLPQSAEVQAYIDLDRIGALQSGQSSNLVYTETDKGFLKIKNHSTTHSVKNVFVLCSHPIIFNFRIKQVTNGRDHRLGPGEELKVPVDFRAALKGLFNVRFLIRYEVQFNNMPQEEIDKIPVMCKHRFQRLMVYINSNFAFNMNPQVHMSVLEPDQYLVNLQTLQKLNATWYERP